MLHEGGGGKGRKKRRIVFYKNNDSGIPIWLTTSMRIAISVCQKTVG